MKKILASLLIAVMLLSLCACVPAKLFIVGQWKSQTKVLGVVTETVYTFNKDGTGTKSNVLDIPFTYSFSEDKLLITTTALGIEITEAYSYDFSVGKLVLTGETETINLEKMK